MRYPCVFVAATVEPISKSPIDSESVCASCIFREFGDQFRISQDSPRFRISPSQPDSMRLLINLISMWDFTSCVNTLNIHMKLHDLFESPLMEITQNPSVWHRWAQSGAAADVRVGFEAELVVPVSEPMDDPEPEPNYSEDPAAVDIEEIVDFYSSTSFGMSRTEANRLRDRMQQDFDSYLEEKLDEAFDELGYGMVRTLAREQGMNAEQIDELMDTQPDEYDQLADQVREQLTDQLYQETNERDWLRSVGIRHMSHVESEYNVTWPIWETPKANQSLEQLKQVAQSMEHALSVTVLASTSYHTVPRIPTAWVLEPDSSIRVSDESSQVGLELITPSPPPLPETLQYMNNVFAWAKSYGCETNRTTGFHMNMSLPPDVHEKLDPVKLILLLGDEKILADFGRSANTYAQSAFREIENHVSITDNFPVEKALTALRSGMMKLAANMIQKPFWNKYVSVHVKPSYVEFRHMGGDYLDQLPEIKLTLLRMAYTLHVAAHDDQAKQEYAKKLYKLLSGFARPAHVDAVVNLFSLYHAQVIDATVLKNSIRQMRKDRPKILG
jgi:hypothetical protein